jgi:hypothetical protein
VYADKLPATVKTIDDHGSTFTTGTGEHVRPIRLSLDDKFDARIREQLLGVTNEDRTLSPPGDVLRDFCKATYLLDNNVEISGIHFLIASTNLNCGYFELRMCRLLELLALLEDQSGCVLGTPTYEFFHRCVLKVWNYGLTEPFIGEFEEAWYNLSMVPDISVPLTPAGTDVLEHLWSNLDAYMSVSDLAERFNTQSTLAREISRLAQSASDKLDASDRLGEVPR